LVSEPVVLQQQRRRAATAPSISSSADEEQREQQREQRTASAILLYVDEQSWNTFHNCARYRVYRRHFDYIRRLVEYYLFDICRTDICRPIIHDAHAAGQQSL
jgi:hypothetical protein